MAEPGARSIDDKELLAFLKDLPPEERDKALQAAGETAVMAFDTAWPVWAHPGQVPPHDDWTVWVAQAGRGFGKTRAGAEWISARAREHPGASIALVAATTEEARQVMVEGRGGLLRAARDGEERLHMHWEPGLRRLTFASGAQAFLYSGADGDKLRGPEHHFAWCDELAKWKQAQAAWDNLMLGLRAGARPQVVVTTTPRPVPALHAVLAAGQLVLTRGRSRDNPHIAAAALAWAEASYAGTRLGRQELDGELLEDVQGALWTRALIERSRVPPFLPELASGRGTAAEGGGGGVPRTARDHLTRILIGVDPPATAAGDECGIIVCGLGADGIGYVLADRSAGGLSPEQWARRVAETAETWQADRIIAEGNQGGEMVEAVLRGAGIRLGVTRVHATRNKLRRAEPVAALFEQGEAKFAGRFPELEDQLAGLVTGGGYEGPGQGSHRSTTSMGSRSPDRADAMVWALTQLMLKKQRPEPGVRFL